MRILILLACLYVVWSAGLYLVQDRLLFPADLAPPPLPSGHASKTTVEMARRLDDGGRVFAWFLPAPTATVQEPGPAVVYFHGNAEIIDYQDGVVEGYHHIGCSVLLPEYRGYGRSGGKPGEKAILADAIYFYDQLVQRPEVDSTRIVFHGRSLGGGPAAQLALQRKPRALILESTFSSVAVMAHKYAVPSFLVKNPFRTDRVVQALDAPMLIFHGAHDDIIPVSHGRRLRDLAPPATYVEYDCAHNDFPGQRNEAAYWDQVAAFLRKNGVIGSAVP
jgi:hypothetical protein